MVQPKRLALLVFLAATAPRFCRRDTLTAMFWPELDGERARGALRQAIYFLRSVLGEGVIITRGDELGIDEAKLSYDVRALEHSSQSGDGKETLALHGGGYLQGFHVADVAPELEQWIDAERSRLQTLAFRAARDLANECEARNDYPDAIEWARRCVALQPDDEPAARRLIALLDRTGDRAGALQAYETFAARLSAEQEVEPSIETRHLVDAVRQREVPTNAVVVAPTERAASVYPLEPKRLAPTLPSSARSGSRARRWYAAAAVAASVAAVLAMRAWRARAPERTTAAAERPTSASPVARELYALGFRQWESRSDSSLRRAVDYYSQAIEKDPKYAAAYAGLAAAYAYLGTGNYSDFEPREAGIRAKAAAQRAITLDDSLADAHAVLGFVRMLYDYDFTGADAAFQRALALDPTNTRTLQLYSIFLDWMGRFDEAVEKARSAVTLDRRSVSISTEFARALFFAKRYDEALTELERAKTLDSTFSRIYLTAGEIYAMKRQYSRAIAELSRDAGTPGRPPRTQAFLGLVLARAGQRARAERILEDLKARARVGGVGAFDVATVYIGLGDYDQAFLWLDRAYDDRSLRPFIMDPTFEDVRRDPRMTVLFNRIGLRPPR